MGKSKIRSIFSEHTPLILAVNRLFSVTQEKIIKKSSEMEKIDSFKPIDPAKIKSPSINRKVSVNAMALSSRGMKFLNLVIFFCFFFREFFLLIFSQQFKVRQNNASPRNLAAIVNAQNLETKTPEKQGPTPMLTFSDKKHNPEASPSNSILSKRKLECSPSPLSAKVGFLGISIGIFGNFGFINSDWTWPDLPQIPPYFSEINRQVQWIFLMTF
jgi:hypothetical protein